MDLILGKPPKIKQVTPIGFFELVVEFDDSGQRIFSPEANGLYKQHPFLAYPHKIKSFTYSSERITWYNGVSFDSAFMYKNSAPATVDQLKYKSLSISSVNRAPTKEHQSHHVFGVSILPFNLNTTFSLDQSIGGSFGDMGGSRVLSVEDLLKRNDWKEHFEKSGCEWVIPLIEQHQTNLRLLVDTIVLEVCKRTDV